MNTTENTQETSENEEVINNEATIEIETETEVSPTEKLEAELSDIKDKYLRLQAEFDNFRRRTAKERIDLINSASKDLIVNLLPVIDDFERGLKSFETATEVAPLTEGILLIHNKLYKTLESKGLKPINAKDSAFDPELHEAITQIPAPTENLKGKVIDEVEKGYFLNDTVVRFSKVVIGA